MGPIMPYENGSAKDGYDPRRLLRNALLPPQSAIPPAYGFQRTEGKIESSERKPVEAEKETQQKSPTHQGMPGKMAPDVAVDMQAHDIHQSPGPKAGSSKDIITMDANLLQVQPPYDGIAAAAHRKVSSVQFGALINSRSK